MPENQTRAESFLGGGFRGMWRWLAVAEVPGLWRSFGGCGQGLEVVGGGGFGGEEEGEVISTGLGAGASVMPAWGDGQGDSGAARLLGGRGESTPSLRKVGALFFAVG